MDDPEMSDFPTRPEADPKWWPSFRYRSDGEGGVESRIFQHPGDVPDGAGWVDSPAAVNDAPAKPKAATAALNGEAGGIQPPYDAHKFHVLRLELQRRTGKGTRPGTSKVQLVAMLEALDA